MADIEDVVSIICSVVEIGLTDDGGGGGVIVPHALAVPTDLYHYTVGFWCYALYKKFLQRFDNRFETKMKVKIYAIQIIFKSNEPFQSYQLTGLA